MAGYQRSEIAFNKAWTRDNRRPKTSASAGPSTSTPSDAHRRKVKRKPAAIVAYNKGKGGIDLSDQYSSLRKGIKWYRKLAFEILFGISVINAYLLYKSVSSKYIGLRVFKEKLVESLLDLQSPQNHPKPKGPRQHILKQVENKVARSRRRCVRCYATIAETEGREAAMKKSKQVNT